MKASTSDVIRATERVLVSMQENVNRVSASEVVTDKFLVVARRQQVDGQQIEGFTNKVNARKWIELTIEVEE